MVTITGKWVGSTSALSTLQNLNAEQTVLNAASLYNLLETEFWNGNYPYGSLMRAIKKVKETVLYQLLKNISQKLYAPLG